MPVKAVGWARSFRVSQGVKAGRDWAREHLEMLGWTERAPETADAVVLLSCDEVVVDRGLVTSRKPDDIPAYNREMIKLFSQARSRSRHAA